MGHSRPREDQEKFRLSARTDTEHRSEHRSQHLDLQGRVHASA